MCTAIPASLPPCSSHSPVCTPARMSSPIPRTDSTAASAQRIARAGPSKLARKPSPAVSISLPRKRSSWRRTAAWCASSSSRQRRSPSSVALLGRADDVCEQHRRQHSVGLVAPPAPRSGTLGSLRGSRPPPLPAHGTWWEPGSSTYRAPSGCWRPESARSRRGRPGRPTRWTISVGTWTDETTPRTSMSIATRHEGIASRGVAEAVCRRPNQRLRRLLVRLVREQEPEPQRARWPQRSGKLTHPVLELVARAFAPGPIVGLLLLHLRAEQQERLVRSG